MVNRDANIDLLFRNGLKDYEVLPPVQVWNNIFPVVRKKQRPVLVLRSAALVAVLLSVSFLAYRWSREIPNSDQNLILAMGEESAQFSENSSGSGNFKTALPNITKSEKVSADVITDQPQFTAISDEQNIVSDNESLISEMEYLPVKSNLLRPSGIQTLRGLSYSVDNANSVYNSLDNLDYELPKEKIDRWSVSAMASPTIYMRPELATSDVATQISSSEQSKISYSGGVGFAYKISKKLSIQSGLYYSSIGNEVDGINSFAGFSDFDYTKGDHNFEVLTSNGRIYTDNADVFLRDNSGGDRVLTRYTNDVFDPLKANLSYINSSLVQNFSYLEMPVIVRYKLIDKSVDFNLIGGFSYNLLVNNSVHTVVDGNRYNVGKTEGVNPLMVSSSVGMGMEYNLSDKFSLNLEPTFRYYLNPFGEFPGMKTHPYSFGIFSGLSYKF